jgi:hypothetical protein
MGETTALQNNLDRFHDNFELIPQVVFVILSACRCSFLSTYLACFLISQVSVSFQNLLIVRPLLWPTLILFSELSMDSHSIRDDHSPLPSQVPRTPVFPFPAEYPSLNFTAEAVNLDPPPLYSAFKDAFVRNYSLPYPTHDATPSGIVAENVEAAESRSAILEKLVTNWWLWEILSWVLSASCMCAIALVLGLYNNRSLPSRWPMGISLNALISILSAIAKYGLTVPLQEAIGQLKWAWFRKGEPRKLIDLDRFDEASRGPWGSLALILRMRGRFVS